MLRFALSLPVLLVVLAAPVASQSAKDEPKEKNTGLEKGKDLPGPFHPYNATGPRAGRYHCLVTRTSLDPVVIVLVGNQDYPDTLKSLVEELENRIVKNPNVRLSSFTVFLRDKPAKPDDDDDTLLLQADELVKRSKASNLQNMVFCLENRANLTHYGLAENAWVTVVLVNRYKVESVHSLTKDMLTPEKVNEIIGQVAEQLGARRK